MENNYQSIFDKVLFALREQGRPGWNEDTGGCAYRGSDGTKCAIGHLISDKEFKLSKLRNGDSVDAAPDSLICKILSIPLSERHKAISRRLADAEGFLSSLQVAHDAMASASPAFWRRSFEDQMKEVAKVFKLKYTPLKAKRK